MIKLLGLLLTFSTVNADIFTFYLPDEGSRFEHHVLSRIKNAHTHITIVAPSIDFAPLRKAVIRPLSRGTHLTLIVQNPAQDPLYYISYKNTDLYLYEKRLMSDTLILIDNTHLCHLPQGLSDKQLTRNALNVWCTDDAQAIHTAQQYIHRMIKRSRPYLE
ncbi:MAG TPA: hypothetical protein VFX57_04210 [Sulfuricurvum sp.]|nr:hypothetical protein [Sulfuricurvum sp.]